MQKESYDTERIKIIYPKFMTGDAVVRNVSVPELWRVCLLKLDYEQSLFFLSPSKKTRENAHTRD